MSISVPQYIIKQAKHDVTKSLHESAMRFSSDDREIALEVTDMPDEAIREIIDIIESSKLNKSVTRMLKSVLNVRSGKHGESVTNLRAFIPMFVSYMKHDMLSGWLFKRGRDGNLYPYLITDMRYSPPDGDKKAKVAVHLVSYANKSEYRSNYTINNTDEGFTLYGEDVVRRNLYDILISKGFEKETPELLALYQQEMQYFLHQVEGCFAEQFVITGPKLTSNLRENADAVIGRKVILNTEIKHYAPRSRGYPVGWLSKNVGLSHYRREVNLSEEDELDDSSPVLPIPEHSVVEVFDLATHETYWVHSNNLLRYRYDKTLREKLVLPDSHRDLLDILTTDIGAFIDDIIDGKSAGNVILCQGKPGVGKTLTAEIYSELIERPLYAVHSGTLGTTAEQIEKKLKEVFKDARRWNAVLLLDEADVFVAQRRQNIEQNAIVAEFLRTLEYFDGLMFMTTNRADDIDEAILSRCAAIIHYEAPKGDDLAAVWRVMAKQFDAGMNDDLISALLPVFVDISPRDIKMLLRLALRVSKFHQEPLSVDLFKRCALFRSIKFANCSNHD